MGSHAELGMALDSPALGRGRSADANIICIIRGYSQRRVYRRITAQVMPGKRLYKVRKEKPYSVFFINHEILLRASRISNTLTFSCITSDAQDKMNLIKIRVRAAT